MKSQAPALNALRADAASPCAVSREHDQRPVQVARGKRGLNLCATRARHPQVEQHDRRGGRSAELREERVTRFVRKRCVAVEAHQQAQRIAHCRIVVDDMNGEALGHRVVVRSKAGISAQTEE